MSSHRVSPGMAIAFGYLLAFSAAVHAGAPEVEWRHDYDSARREAREKNRPLVMDFGTAHCVWCKKLDTVTFRDPVVIAQMNEQFIGLKIDADQEARLAQTLRIQSFPTLLFAAPDGKILGIHEGFVDAARFRQQLQRALDESAASGKSVPAAADVVPPRPPIVRAAAPDDPAVSSPDRIRSARELLAVAQDDFQNRRYLGCLERCRLLGTLYADLPAAREARRLTDRIINDPDLARRASEKLTDQLGDLYLDLAERARNQGQTPRAMEYLERVLRLCPDSSRSLAARLQLDKLQSGAGEAKADKTQTR